MPLDDDVIAPPSFEFDPTDEVGARLTTRRRPDLEDEQLAPTPAGEDRSALMTSHPICSFRNVKCVETVCERSCGSRDEVGLADDDDGTVTLTLRTTGMRREGWVLRQNVKIETTMKNIDRIDTI